MEFLRPPLGWSPAELHQQIGREVRIEGYVEKLRNLGGVSFLLLRTATARAGASGTVQVAVERSVPVEGRLCEAAFVETAGAVRLEPRAAAGLEIAAARITVLAAPETGFSLSPGALELGLETELEMRPVSLRHPRRHHAFKIQAALVEGFRRCLSAAGFTEIFTPKLVAGNAEGGANVFSVPYFGQEASLAQSPQLYKQMMVGVFERVYEIGHVYRAEPHNSSRHLNEYIGLDVEAGFLKGLRELIEIELACLSAMFEAARELCAESLAHLKLELP